MKRLKDMQIILTTSVIEEVEANAICLIRACKNIISTRPQFDYKKIFNNMKQLMSGQEMKKKEN